MPDHRPGDRGTGQREPAGQSAQLHRPSIRGWDRAADRLSARYPIALAARVVREVATLLLLLRADKADERPATLTLDTEPRFRSAAEWAAFTTDLANAVTSLVSRYHDTITPRGHPHRLIVVSHPSPPTPPPSPPPSSPPPGPAP